MRRAMVIALALFCFVGDRNGEARGSEITMTGADLLNPGPTGIEEGSAVGVRA